MKKLEKSGKVNIKELSKILNDIAAGVPLDKKYGDHPMVKTSPKHYQGCRDFHYKANICVIYKILPTMVELIRIGSHQDLGLTESIDIFPRGYFDKYKISDEEFEKVKK